MVFRPWSFFKCCRLLNNGVRQYAGGADILCIIQITFLIVHNALLAKYRWFWLTHLEVFTYFATLQHRLKSVISFVA